MAYLGTSGSTCLAFDTGAVGFPSLTRAVRLTSVYMVGVASGFLGQPNVSTTSIRALGCAAGQDIFQNVRFAAGHLVVLIRLAVLCSASWCTLARAAARAWPLTRVRLVFRLSPAQSVSLLCTWLVLPQGS